LDGHDWWIRGLDTLPSAVPIISHRLRKHKRNLLSGQENGKFALNKESRRWTQINVNAKPEFIYLRLSAFISGFFFFSVNGYENSKYLHLAISASLREAFLFLVAAMPR